MAYTSTWLYHIYSDYCTMVPTFLSGTDMLLLQQLLVEFCIDHKLEEIQMSLQHHLHKLAVDIICIYMEPIWKSFSENLTFHFWFYLSLSALQVYLITWDVSDFRSSIMAWHCRRKKSTFSWLKKFILKNRMTEIRVGNMAKRIKSNIKQNMF